MKIEITKDFRKIDFKKWDNFVYQHPNGSIFQASDSFGLFEKTKNFEPVVIQLSENQKIVGTLLAVIIKEYSGSIGFLSSRTVVYGGPLISSSNHNNHQLLDVLLKSLIDEVKNKSVFIQFRNFWDWSELKDVFIENNFHFLERLNFLVDTSSEELVNRKISKSKLRQIKKGLKLGAEIIEPEGIEQVKEFYDILYYLYKYKVKKPLPKWSFFESFYKQTCSKKLGIIRLIKFEDKIIGGILSPITTNKVIYEWYICGLDREYKDLYPSVLATWAAIEYAIANDIQSFDFMGVGVPNKDYGVRDFKAKFGGDMVNFGRFGRINNKFLYSITEIGFNILALLKRI